MSAHLHPRRRLGKPGQTKTARPGLTRAAADFVRTLRTAEQLEDKGQYGSSMAWYLKAQQIYPASEYATDALGRLVKQVLPEG